MLAALLNSNRGECIAINLSQTTGLIDLQLRGTVRTQKEKAACPHHVERFQHRQVEFAWELGQNHFALNSKLIQPRSRARQFDKQPLGLRSSIFQFPFLDIFTSHLRDADIRNPELKRLQSALDHTIGKHAIQSKRSHPCRSDCVA